MGIGLWEILVIILLIVVLINPKDLPKIARRLGKWYRKFRDVQSQVDRELKSVEEEFRKPFDDTEKELKGLENGFKGMADSVKHKRPLPDLKSVMPSRSVNISSNKDDTRGEADQKNNIEQNKQHIEQKEDIEV